MARERYKDKKWRKQNTERILTQRPRRETLRPSTPRVSDLRYLRPRLHRGCWQCVSRRGGGVPWPALAGRCRVLLSPWRRRVLRQQTAPFFHNAAVPLHLWEHHGAAPACLRESSRPRLVEARLRSSTGKPLMFAASPFESLCNYWFLEEKWTKKKHESRTSIFFFVTDR